MYSRTAVRRAISGQEQETKQRKLEWCQRANNVEPQIVALDLPCLLNLNRLTNAVRLEDFFPNSGTCSADGLACP
jgi:hypothetical protein